MLNYAVCEISGKQYKVVPNIPFLVDWQGEDAKDVEVNVLMTSEGEKIELGEPFLKEKLNLTCLETVKQDKIMVSKFHAKANYRRTTGHRARMTKVVLTVKK